MLKQVPKYIRPNKLILFFILHLSWLVFLVDCFWIGLLFLQALIPEMSMSGLPRFSSLLHYCWTHRNSLVLKILLPVASLQKIRIHLLPLDAPCKSSPAHSFSKMMKLCRFRTRSSLLSQIHPTFLHLLKGRPKVNRKEDQCQECQWVWRFSWFD